jgi:alpha-amylase
MVGSSVTLLAIPMRKAAFFVVPALLVLSGLTLAQSAPRKTAEWTKGATCYEIFVRSFKDSNGDGIGDIPGLISKLDYINDGDPKTQNDLGARCVWLMPIAESPSYHGYDASDYYTVERDYGTNADFKQLMAEAHKRGIKVLVDMVLNHSSNEHPFFRAALMDTASPYRAMYRFSTTDSASKGPWGQLAWHKNPYGNEYYYGVFWAGMPDLNYENAITREEAKKVATFWLKEMNVDGFRLDAVPYLVEEGKVLAGSPGTHRVLAEYAAHVRSINPESYTVGEVWDSVGAMLPYYPDQLDSYFAFELSDAILNAVRTADAKKIYPGYQRLLRTVSGERFSPFLRNHDESRARTELGGSMAKQKVASFLLLTLPGLPFVYYGEEIGMIASKPDERLRTPMQWTSEPGAGFTTGKPWEQLQDDSATTTVAAQDRDPKSLLNLHRKLIHLRADNPAIGHGALIPLETSDSSVAAFLRQDGDRTVLVVANLSEHARHRVALATLDMVLPRGTYYPRNLLGREKGATLLVGSNGRIGSYRPLVSLEPLTGYVFELSTKR